MDLKHIDTLVRPIITNLGYDIVSITVEKEMAYNGQKTLVVTISKEDGVTISDCVRVSKKINPILQEEASIPDSYIISVSSQGIEDQQ